MLNQGRRVIKAYNITHCITQLRIGVYLNFSAIKEIAMLDCVTTTPSPAAAPSLDTTFGFSESFRKVVATGLLAMSGFITGCAKTLEERCVELDSVPQVSVTQLVDRGVLYQENEVAVGGYSHFVADRSYTTTSLVPMPISNGKTTTVVLMPVTTNHPNFDYTIADQPEQSRLLNAHSTFKIPEGSVMMRGKMADQGKGMYFEVSDAMTQGDYQQGHSMHSHQDK